MSANGVSNPGWELTKHITATPLLEQVIPKPLECQVLVLKTPTTEFLFSLGQLGCKGIHVVEKDLDRCGEFTRSLTGTTWELRGDCEDGKRSRSEDGRLILHKAPFESLTGLEVKFSAIFDLGYVSEIPSLAACSTSSTTFGEKLIRSAAEDAKMVIFTVETFNGISPQMHIHTRNDFELNAIYGRGFFLKKYLETDHAQGYTEILYLAEKCWAGKTYYDKKYSKGYSPWHAHNVNPNLLKHYRQIQPENEPLRKILMPLCGKSVDIKWLADRGHQVVGLEIAETAVREIFSRDDIAFEVIDSPELKGKIFRSLDGRIRLYNCDIFNFSTEVEGEWDTVWERGAVLALDKELKARYYAHMKTLVSKGCLWMSSVLQYDRDVYYNHPYCANDEEIRENFSAEFEIRDLDETVCVRGDEAPVYTNGEPCSTMKGILNRTNLQQISDRVYMLIKK